MVKSFLKFLGVSESENKTEAVKETESVRAIIEELESLPEDKAHYLALYSSILSRVANADLDISDKEIEEMEKIIQTLGELEEALVVLVVKIARNQNQLLGGVENYLVTREYSKVSNREQQLQLLQSLFAVAASEDGVSAEENEEMRKIGMEIGLSREDFLAVRAQYKQHLGVFRNLPK